MKDKSKKADVADLLREGHDLGEALQLARVEPLEELRRRVEGAPEAEVHELDDERAKDRARRMTTEGMRLTTDDLVAEVERWGDRWPWDRRGPCPAVQAGLALTKQAMPRPTFANVVKVLRLDPRWESLRLNLLGQRLEHEGEQHDEMVLVGVAAVWLADNYGIHVGARVVEQALATVARDRAYLPHAEWLESLTWDGEERINRLVPEVLGVRGGAQFDLFQSWVRRWMIGAVARALDPGCKVDTALVLFGAQGVKKSTFFSVLAGEWFGDSPIPIGSKDAPIQLQATWIYEAAELESLAKKTAEEVKQFLRTRADVFRGVYERSARPWPRHAVMCGTTNRAEFLTDDTGNRSFWVIPIGSRTTINVDLLRGMRTQLWAEAAAAYAAGEVWWMTRQEDQEAAGYLQQYLETDPWEERIRMWTLNRVEFRTDEVLEEAIKLKAWEQDRRASRRAGAVLRSLGFEFVSVWDREAGRSTKAWRREQGL